MPNNRRDSLRIHQRVVCSIILPMAVICAALCTSLVASEAQAESEAYRRQVNFEIGRAQDFRRFIKFLEQLERERMNAVPGYKLTKQQQDKIFEQARRLYSELRKREEAKKPTEEFVERMLASEAAKEAKEKEAIRREFVKIQKEIERAIANTRLDEAEEYGLAR